MIYKITVQDDDGFFGPLAGEFDGANKSEAIKQAKEWYAAELGTNPSNIEIISAVEIPS
jgi:hypothetical protein